MRIVRNASLINRTFMALAGVFALLFSVPASAGTKDFCETVFSPPYRIVELPAANQLQQQQTVSHLTPGTIVKFSDGTTYRVEKVLSNAAHSTDGIFAVAGGDVLRIPKYAGVTVDQYLDGYRALRDAGVPVPRIIEATRGERILVEQVEVLFHLDEVFLADSRLSSEKLKRLRDEFTVFVEKFKDFNSVADLHALQIVYAKDRGWVLLDWRDRHVMGTSENPFAVVWRSLNKIGDYFGKEYDFYRVAEWREASEAALARARARH